MLEKKYDHNKVEEGKYDFWLENDYFKSGDLSKEPFCIVIPPPNVTGKLHLGHAWDTALQDVIIRYKKMCGYDTLWLPGMDHAAIATESKVVAKLKSEGIDKYKLGREGFLKEAWSWKEEYSKNIRQQWAKLGLALDYSKERFTLDDGLSDTVKYVFVDLYNKGLIYKGKRIINWDPVAKTAVSNEEVIYKDTPGAFYHIKYFLEDSSDYLEVATTRPETIFGDVALAVNEKDARYHKYIGKNVILPIVNRKIPVIADYHADPEFGTGVVKITPAHDPNDFEVGNRHNLDRIVIMNEDATMNENALHYKGMDRFDCRSALVKELDKLGLLISVEPIVHSVGYSERTDAMIEPYLSTQWFLSMDKLSKRVLEVQKDKSKKINFVPKSYEKILTNWLTDCHDWCISRQLWWGHRIPAWYKGDEIYVGIDAPKEEGWVQDNDVLDTWFSSALWPFATLGWLEHNSLFDRYFPTDVLVTGYDIIFFWVARMAFQSLEYTDQRPFKDCLIHGLIRDKEGRKMSKSLGNGVDPMDAISEYGCDSIRFFLTTTSAMGQDLRYDEEKIKSIWNFVNKLWNASRYVLMNIEDLEEVKLDNLSLEDKWILTKYEEVVKIVTYHMDRYEFNLAGSILYDFIWSVFCDKYIEMSKFNIDKVTTKSTLYTVLVGILKMMHPFMPFVTEEIYQMLPIKETKSIMISEYPLYDKKYVYEVSSVDNMLLFVTLFRNEVKELNIHNYGVKVNISDIEISILVKNMLKLNDKDNVDGYSISKNIIKDDLEITIFYNDETNKEDERKKLEKEREKLENSINRREVLLGNYNYVNKAPSSVVENDRVLLSKEKKELDIILDKLNNL